MCGIVGFITTDEKKYIPARRTFMSQALFVDTLRGRDSTGVMAATNEFDIQVVKGTCEGPKFIKTKEYAKVDLTGWAAVGHNRAATHGNISIENAHPFRCGKVTLVHNGTLSNMGRNLPHFDSKLKVDSAVIALNLAEEAPEDAAKLLSRLWGSYALVWFDGRDHSLNIARNNARPLHVGYTQCKALMYFMSDGLMLNMVTNRPHVPIPRSHNIFSVGEGTLLKFKKGSLVPEVTKIAPFPQYGIRYLGKSNPHTGQISLHDHSPGKPAPKNKNKQNNGVPKIHEDQLQDMFQLTPAHEMKFSPNKYLVSNKAIGSVVGTVYHQEWHYEMDAVVHGVNSLVYNTNKKHDWTVSPIGITFALPEFDKHAVIICRTLDYEWKGVPAREDEEELVSGPGNQLIPEDRWYELTKDGCGWCSVPIPIQDHEDVLWFGPGDMQPYCGDCGEIITNPEEYEKGDEEE